MSQRLLPSRPAASPTPRSDYEVGIDDEGAADVFDALATDQSRAILRRLREEPMTASDLAAATDTSIQNATYHLRKLERAGLVAVVDTWYSSRGQEMSVYAPRVSSVVVDCTAGETG
ncbi:MAG: ArsR/SmtB family transcription factor [Haloferacaceae archaeon]